MPWKASGAEGGSEPAVEPGADSIVVTAQRVEQRSADVPISLSVLDEAELEAIRFDDIGELDVRSPNLAVLDWGLRQDTYLYIRGIGNARSSDGSVALYVDDVPYLHYGSFDVLLHDVERVEILRGPQGTLYGRNTLSGVVNIVTTSVFEPETAAGGNLGNHGIREAWAHHRGPIGDSDVALGAYVDWTARDGFTDNTYLDETVDDRDALAGRVGVEWLAGERLTLTAAVHGERNRDGGLPLTDLDEVRSDPHELQHDFAGRQDRDVGGGHLRAVYDAEAWTLTSVTAARAWNEAVDFDADFSEFPVFTGGLRDRQRQLTQEIRIASADDEAGPLTWQFGTFAFAETITRDNFVDYGPFAPAVLTPGPGERTFTKADIDNLGFALFAHTAYELTERWELSGGLRWDVERKEIEVDRQVWNPFAASFVIDQRSDEETFSEVNPKAAITYRWNDDDRTYLSIARGYKSGGFNAEAEQADDFTYDAEFTWNFEIGHKMRLDPGRIDLAASGFLILWDDQQVTQLVGPTFTVTRNVGESRVFGVEFEASARPLSGLELQLGIGLLDAEFTDGPYDGNEPEVAPDYTAQLAIAYAHGIGEAVDWFGRVDLRLVGSSYFDEDNRLEQDPYQLVDLRTGVRGEWWQVSVWSKNLFDEEYLAIAFEQAGLGDVGQAAPPRTFGLAAQVEF